MHVGKSSSVPSLLLAGQDPCKRSGGFGQLGSQLVSAVWGAREGALRCHVVCCELYSHPELSVAS